ncbi:MAG: FkbM family methyltransferase [Lachnospiraceae bacterium]|nr:FkbM family methyltransferase [Lachnospiraceae bacterium]
MNISFIDKTSEEIYRKLVQLSTINDVTYLEQAIKLSGIEPDPAYQYFKWLKNVESKGTKLILYGLGSVAKAMEKAEFERRETPGYLYFPFLGDVEWFGFCDKNDTNFPQGFMGKKVMSVEELLSLKEQDICVCIGAPDFYEEIESELKSLGIHKNKIVRYVWPKTICYENKQYFDDFMEPKKEAIMIDGGCFRCDSLERFIKWNEEKGYEQIISFEPDKNNFEICKNIILKKQWKNVELIHAGLSEKESICNFIESGESASRISEEGESQIRLVSIDQCVGERNVSFIKLDVEGFELETLRGAKKCIQRDHPRMAISLYHKKEDIIEIPKYILELSEDYHFYLRIYSNAYLEIVLYAI